MHWFHNNGLVRITLISLIDLHIQQTKAQNDLVLVIKIIHLIISSIDSLINLLNSQQLKISIRSVSTLLPPGINDPLVSNQLILVRINLLIETASLNPTIWGDYFLRIQLWPVLHPIDVKVALLLTNESVLLLPGRKQA